MTERETHKDQFQRKLGEFAINYPQESLLGGLLFLTANQEGTVWEIIDSQLDHLVRKNHKNGGDVTKTQLIESLFKPADGKLTAEIVIDRIQG